jgi:hypothetical protein
LGRGPAKDAACDAADRGANRAPNHRARNRAAGRAGHDPVSVSEGEARQSRDNHRRKADDKSAHDLLLGSVKTPKNARPKGWFQELATCES